MDNVVLAPWVRHAGFGVAILLFIVGLLLQRQVRTARNGNRLSALGMLLAVVLGLADLGAFQPAFIVAGIAVGAAIGLVAAYRVQMTAMPQMVAMFNGMGGAASMLVALSYLHEQTAAGGVANRTLAVVVGADGAVTTLLSVGIGAVTLAGSVVAFLKLQSWIPGGPILLPRRHALHGLMAALILVLFGLVAFGLTGPGGPVAGTWVFTAAALVLGALLVLPIGGADMPVVISLLNSYSGLAAAMTGFVLKNVLLIVVGSLVGASGIVLTRIMSKAMNRSLASVLLGGVGGSQPSFGRSPASSPAGDAGPEDGVDPAPVVAAHAAGVEAGVAGAVKRLQDATRIIVVPGYGMALARAQFDVVRLTRFLEGQGKDVRFAVHPVAGRMPGHMNVLLAEADVDYEKLIELEDVNREFPSTDVVLVVGACDVVNPAANDPTRNTPLSGMPILEAGRARSVVVCNLDANPGYSGVENPLYRDPKTLMLLGDAHQTIQGVRRELGDSEGLDAGPAIVDAATDAAPLQAGMGG
jgi:NAD(P) transhydrogenase subunit beta